MVGHRLRASAEGESAACPPPSPRRWATGRSPTRGASPVSSDGHKSLHNIRYRKLLRHGRGSPPPDNEIVARLLSVAEPQRLMPMLENLMHDANASQDSALQPHSYGWFVYVALSRIEGIHFTETRKAEQQFRLHKLSPNFFTDPRFAETIRTSRCLPAPRLRDTWKSTKAGKHRDARMV